MPTLAQARQWYDSVDPVHGFEHILRVYRLAEQLAQATGADLEIVRAAALLHDVSDPSQPTEERAGHHHAAVDFARQVLQAEGWQPGRIAAVEHCIRAHRFRDETEAPATLEAQVLFDADKLDAIGAVGVARALGYAFQHGLPAYTPLSDQFRQSLQLAPDERHSAYHEYYFKLRHLKDRLYTPAARQLAAQRHRRMEEFFEALAEESQPEA